MSKLYSTNKFYSTQEILNAVFDPESGTLSVSGGGGGGSSSAKVLPPVTTPDDLPESADENTICPVIDEDSDDELTFYWRRNGQWVPLRCTTEADVSDLRENVEELNKITSWHQLP